MSELQRFRGSKMNALGYSLTHGDITGAGTDGIPWTSYMTELAGLTICRNYGENGRQIAGTGGMTETFPNMDNHADIVCVFGGINDFCRGIPLGAIEDTGISTFYGALKCFIQRSLCKISKFGNLFYNPSKM